MITQGDVWWADLGEPRGSEAAFRRPVIVVQSDALNRSKLATVVVMPLTSNLKWAAAPGNVLLGPEDTRLPRESVAVASQLVAVDKATLVEHAGRVSVKKLALIFSAVDVVLGRA